VANGAGPHCREAGIVARLGHFLSIFQATLAWVTIRASLDLPQLQRFFQTCACPQRRKHGTGMEPAAICGVYLFA